MSEARPVALVTGGSRGIGRAICVELAGRGFDVAVAYRTRAEEAAAVVRELLAMGAGAEAIQADVCSQEQVLALFQRIRKRWRRLAVLVNNAGVLYEELFALTPLDSFWQVMQTNLGGTVQCCRQALPMLAASRRGRIINLASLAALDGGEGLSAYAASKAAIIALSRVLSRELLRAGVAVNVVAPGLVDTDMTAQMNPAAKERALARQPLGRMATPKEVASLVGYLALEAPPDLTGKVLRLDGRVED
jgi:NAD(P)-dependent dehydrogenase (short-subunit alcohol dehydrogenase family)